MRLFSRMKVEALKVVAELGRELDLEKAVNKRWVVRLSDNDTVVKRTFLATAEKTPAHVDGSLGITLEDDSQNIWSAEKELEDVIRGVDLIRVFA